MKVKFRGRKSAVARCEFVLNHERQSFGIGALADLCCTLLQHQWRAIDRAQDEPGFIRFLVEKDYCHRLGIFADLSGSLVMSPTLRLGPLRHDDGFDQFGMVHDTDRLMVADASLFPSPIGVNPMETIMALATRCAAHVIDNAGRYLS